MLILIEIKQITLGLHNLYTFILHSVSCLLVNGKIDKISKLDENYATFSNALRGLPFQLPHMQ